MPAVEPEKEFRSVAQALGLHTHLFLFTLLMLVSILTSSVLFYLRARDDRFLETAVKRDLHLLNVVAGLRTRIHEIDPLFDVNNKTNDPTWLAKRGRRIERLQDSARELAPGPYDANTNALLSRLQGQLASLLSDQEKEIQVAARTKRRQADLERAAAAAARKGVYDALNLLSSSATLELESSVDKTRKTTVDRMMVRFGIELLAALFIAFYLYYFIIAPISEIDRTARQWKVGQPWNHEPVRAIPEIRGLLSKFSRNASSVNAQFLREHELNDFKTKLVSLVTHEFGNGLAVIQSAAHLLEEFSSEEELAIKGKFIAMISSNARALNLEVLNLLNMSRLEAGKLAISFTKVDGAAILESVADRLALLAEKKRLSVRLELAPGLPPIQADPSTLALVVSNLLTNAIKYTPDGGRICVGVQAEQGKPDFYRFYVQDTGIGLSNEDQSKIFNGGGFFRAESGMKMTSKGFGIGLTLAKNIVEAHGSSLELASSPGNGSRFSFLMPVWRPNAATLFLKEKEVELIRRSS